jgi:Diacylglycerol kinase catalytic domain
VIKIGLLSNPNSQRNKRGLDDLHAASAAIPDLLHHEVDGEASLAETLRDFARREVGLLVLNGGDGTVQRALTELLEGRPFERPPLLAILPRGMANMTAGDVGLRGRSANVLRRLGERTCAGDLEPNVVRRKILRVENVRGRPPQRGLFFGAAAIYDAIELCCREVYARGLKGNLGMGLTLAGLLLGSLLGRSNQALRGHAIAVAIDDQPPVPASRLLVLATTLERLILGARPFWNQGKGSIRFTSIAHPPLQLIRSAPKVLYGWRRTTLSEAHYVSCGAERVALRLDGAFTLDGELFEPVSDQPVLLTATDQLEFVRL